MVKTIRVTDTTWQRLEEKRKELLKLKLFNTGKLERVDVTFEEVILNLLDVSDTNKQTDDLTEYTLKNIQAIAETTAEDFKAQVKRASITQQQKETAP